MATAQTIQIFLPSGNPTGIRVASLTTRTVRVFEVPRPLLREFLTRPESSQVGVYYLFGGDDTEAARAYIGQTGNVGERLRQHVKKEFWTRAMVAVSLTNEWTSTHVAYLEWLSIARAEKADRYVLENENRGSKPFTPEPLEADCVEFLDTIAVLLATLGGPVLEAVPKPSSKLETAPVEEPEQELLHFSEAGCKATGYQTPEGLLVLAGSVGRSATRGAVRASVARQREWALEQHIARGENDKLILNRDHLFSSPTAAAAFLVGGNINGRISWKNSQGDNLNVIEAGDLADSSTQLVSEAPINQHMEP